MTRSMIGLGCMRLSTVTPRDAARATQVIHAALDAGARLLDTADAYCLDDSDVGHNERLVAEALRQWRGDASAIEVATKGGLRRPGGRWVPDGKASHLRAACEASRHALGVDTIDLYQLHVVDPATPLETSVRALAALQREGKVRRIGLCNVTVGQIETARKIAEIASVQVSLSVVDDENLRNGVAEYCRDHDIGLIAYRPLGGAERAKRLERDPVLVEVSVRYGATPHEVALAWLSTLTPRVMPIPGATQVATARSLARVLGLELSADDRDILDARFPAARLLQVPRAVRRPSAATLGDVVLVMGIPAAGKSTVARELVDKGYDRLNRDTQGGKLSDLVTELDVGLASGRRRWVLDNTYASRSSRNEVIECAWRHGVPVRCIWLTTSTPDAQITAVTRLIETHGSLPTPEELRALGKSDHRYFGPDAQFRYERQLEPPTAEEGFTIVEERPFTRRSNPDFVARAVLLDYDGALSQSEHETAAQAETLARYRADGCLLLGIAWRPDVGQGQMTDAAVQSDFERTRTLLGLDIEIAYCPHAAGPPVCWCRKPLPGLVLEFAHRHRLALEQCVLVGRSPSDRTLAQRLGMSYQSPESFFGADG